MKTEEIIGKTITNIYSLVKMEVGGLDTGECFIELNNKFIIDIPFGKSEDIWLKELNKKAKGLFDDLADYPVYHVNKDNRTIRAVSENHLQQRQSIFSKLRNVFYGKHNAIKEYQPYKTDYRENKLKHIKDRIIVDFIWYAEDCDKGLFLLDNGYLITETVVAPHGTGLTGLNYFENLESLIERRGYEYSKLSDEKKVFEA